MDRFWRWKTNNVRDQAERVSEERELFLNGAIASESWFDDDVTPAVFRDELISGEGNITVWINSPGGDCFAAAQIYNMLRAYSGKVTVKVDSLAASAASVIAMAGDEVQISPAGMFMIHNPSTIAMGDHGDLEKAIDMLGEVKNSIITAYQQRTGLSRNRLSKLMEDETWMDATKAIELGFADIMIERNSGFENFMEMPAGGCIFSSHPFEMAVTNQVIDYARKLSPEDKEEPDTPPVRDGVSDADKSPTEPAEESVSEDVIEEEYGAEPEQSSDTENQGSSPIKETAKETETQEASGIPADDLYMRLRKLKEEW